MPDFSDMTGAEIAENGSEKQFEADVVERDGAIWGVYDSDSSLALVVPGNSTLSDVKFFTTQVQLYVSKRLGAVA
ncbi:hypothetical protein LF599_06565 [Pseudodesulfovibrio thermohalotolerans]|uniref:hypothetical protein n=1 Tax=Pseudodesulfovibrio thermohalotolerans TaxID=2880651 RepID=UPI002441E41F|nr:hypothetical protein [Pseudodesulfovibrio thermohalotolerans]WFS63821.1 hypothetical protein LF599_06565 [Pseudodesulfovibrio thermohalotolerans]